MTEKKNALLMDAQALAAALARIADAIVKEMDGDPGLVIIGIRTRGVTLANRLAALLKERLGREVPLGILDITLYRDDLSTLAEHPIVRPTTLPFDIDGKKIILVDDVIYTGRTIRAALDQIVDFGRPRSVRLAALVDRGWREYPIQPDFTGMKTETRANQLVQVRLSEIDGEEKVMLLDLNGR
ncbi:MAG TPA: bifunctional pyr operon transcriptional regulator/uracil phosphoribosyltransferase PyrR [Candidatus Sumerlaeota bacterium]|nr:bifunctional pyr operon transcriptional regulator/uracil phosphoribosyltransferase PyrR [Candidatus Sumerlaeota bacterium]